MALAEEQEKAEADHIDPEDEEGLEKVPDGPGDNLRLASKKAREQGASSPVWLKTCEEGCGASGIGAPLLGAPEEKSLWDWAATVGDFPLPICPEKRPQNANLMRTSVTSW